MSITHKDIENFYEKLHLSPEEMAQTLDVSVEAITQGIEEFQKKKLLKIYL